MKRTATPTFVLTIPLVVKPGEDPRSGRWRGWDKVECGIHTPTDPNGMDDPIF